MNHVNLFLFEEAQEAFQNVNNNAIGLLIQLNANACFLVIFDVSSQFISDFSLAEV